MGLVAQKTLRMVLVDLLPQIHHLEQMANLKFEFSQSTTNMTEQCRVVMTCASMYRSFNCSVKRGLMRHTILMNLHEVAEVYKVSDLVYFDSLAQEEEYHYEAI